MATPMAKQMALRIWAAIDGVIWDNQPHTEDAPTDNCEAGKWVDIVEDSIQGLHKSTDQGPKGTTRAGMDGIIGSNRNRVG